MKLWITKPWSPLQLGALKLCCLAIGVALGATFARELDPYVSAILGAALVLAIFPAHHYFRD